MSVLKRSIVVVSNFTGDARFVRLHLKERGYEAKLAPSLKEALEELENPNPEEAPIALIIDDEHYIDKRDKPWLRQVRERHQFLPIFVYTRDPHGFQVYNEISKVDLLLRAELVESILTLRHITNQAINFANTAHGPQQFA